MEIMEEKKSAGLTNEDVSVLFIEDCGYKIYVPFSSWFHCRSNLLVVDYKKISLWLNFLALKIRD
jgi:hypothetical protein